MPLQPEQDLGLLFHLQSSYSNARNDGLELKSDVSGGHFRTYPGSERYPLPECELASDLPLRSALIERRSTRELQPGPMPIEQFASILRASYGVMGWSDESGSFLARRPVPSAGSLYPLEIYAATQGVTGLPDGLFHYDARGNALEMREPGCVHTKLAPLTWVPGSILGANLVILITGVIERTTWKYGLRGYRFLWLEAGHLAQNLYLIATALGLGVLAVGAFSDEDVDRLARLSQGERSLYLLCMGASKQASP